MAENLRALTEGGGWITPVGAGGGAAPQTRDRRGREGLRLLRRVGVVDPRSLDDYRAHGGYEALRRAVELGSEGVIREVKDRSSSAAVARRSRPA